ncbi:MAG: valine--tRNA ligase [Promethearchaeota archaeon]
MKQEIAQAYNPTAFEQEIYAWWEKKGYFRPEKMIELELITKKDPKYCISIPLPNVTGILHLGHAITISIEDMMTRYNRMLQKETLFIPGTDHAGIATQNVVERELLKKGIKRKELGKDKFLKEVWAWKDYYHTRITEQSKRMGMSSDWSRERFTLDEQCSRAVREAFYRLYQKGLIYRGEYLVNWCPGRCESAISNLETIPKERQSKLWYIRYPIVTNSWQQPVHEWGSGKWAEGATEFITVATTRPETLLGDTAVATTKQHKEYAQFIGKKVILPVNGRAIPVIADEHVDPEFGTGALKITPGHDPNDFEIAQRHNLEIITVLDEKAIMITENSGKYIGMDRFECREAIVEDLEKEGLLEKIEPYVHSEPYCQRCDALIEPRVSLQWFVKTKPLAKAAIERVKKGETVIIPEREEKRFYDWMENIHDWCISRQLWWGHQIPIWYCDECKKEICPLPDVEEVSECPECKSTKIYRDPDVLDTWFSSGLWPFETLGWPNVDHPDYNRFYPTDTRETGYDILFFWVCRELMFGVELTGKVPYSTVYLHGIIRDEKGLKISKSMENIAEYDPLKIISKHGTDSLRYTLISNTIAGMDINLDPRQLEAAHRFGNKIWQSTRFILGNLKEEEEFPRFSKELIPKLNYADKWILSRLNQVVKAITNFMENHDYLNASRELKNFFWNEFCDWYIEITKIRFYDEQVLDKTTPKVLLLHILETCLRLLHPIMPFITEKLWQSLPNSCKEGPALIVAKWPQPEEGFIDDEVEHRFSITIDFIREVRRVRQDFNVNVTAKIPLQIETHEQEEIFEQTKDEIITLAKIDPTQLVISSKIDPSKRAARIVVEKITAYMPLEGLIDIEAEKQQISNRLGKLEKEIKQLNAKLNGPFSERAPPQIVQKEKDKLEALTFKQSQLKDQLTVLE